MSDLLPLAAVGALSWLLRVMFLVVVPAERLPGVLRSSLDDLAPAALGAIVATDLVLVLGQDGDGVGRALTAAAVAALGVSAWLSRSLVTTTGLAFVLVCALDFL